MAKVAEQYIVVKISKLVKNSDSDELEILDNESIEGLVAIVQEMVDGVETGYIVEHAEEKS